MSVISIKFGVLKVPQDVFLYIFATVISPKVSSDRIPDSGEMCEWISME